jgi:hypothetical protein
LLRYCGKIDALSLELQTCKRQLILQQKKSERAMADLAAAGANEISAVHQHYSILIKDLDQRMQDMQAQIDSEQSIKRDWTQAQRKNIQSARASSEKFALLQVSRAPHTRNACPFVLLSPCSRPAPNPLLQNTCDTAVHKAAKLDVLYSEQLRLNQVIINQSPVSKPFPHLLGPGRPHRDAGERKRFSHQQGCFVYMHSATRCRSCVERCLVGCQHAKRSDGSGEQHAAYAGTKHSP